MSRENTSTDNAVAEKFIRTFKEHTIDGFTIEERMQNYLFRNPNFKSFRAIINQYVKSLNENPNKKSNKTAPHEHDTSSHMAEIKRYTVQKDKVISILDELAAKKTEVVDKTPFDDYANSIALKMIDQRIVELYQLVAQNPQITQE